eukprot:gb/GECG01005770.1/.p1 GENE.gb/GECG01005770.1/~~gb/GECG01005770.1/.p1  ORF type:complete len:193 (+),score=31.60 gb/GECG01005770.1/:1-579(+)
MQSSDNSSAIPREIEEQVRQEGCGLTSSQSTQCRTVNGETKCQEEVSYYKRCPGKKPELVYRNKTETEGAPQEEMESFFPSLPSSSSIFGGGGRGQEKEDFFGPFSDFFKSFERAFSGREFDEEGRRGFPFPGRSHRGALPGPGSKTDAMSPEKADANAPNAAPAPWVNETDPHRRIDEARKQASKHGGTYV